MGAVWWFLWVTGFWNPSTQWPSDPRIWPGNDFIVILYQAEYNMDKLFQWNFIWTSTVTSFRVLKQWSSELLLNHPSVRLLLLQKSGNNLLIQKFQKRFRNGFEAVKWIKCWTFGLTMSNTRLSCSKTS